MAVFGDRKSPDERLVKDCVQMVETFLRNVGLDPKAQRFPEPDALVWFAVGGNAKLFIFIENVDGTTTLGVNSPILYLPSQNLLPFYRRCLELNRGLLNCAICVLEDEVILTSTRSAQGLDYSELERTFYHLSGTADMLAKNLAEEFGAKLWMGGWPKR